MNFLVTDFSGEYRFRSSRPKHFKKNYSSYLQTFRH